MPTGGRALGAHQVIDYAAEDFTAGGPIFDAVLDTLGGEVHARCAAVLKPGGVLAFLSAAPVQQGLQKDVRLMPTEVRPTRERLERLLALGLRSPVERRVPLESGASAYEHSRGGHARGKIVLQIEPRTGGKTTLRT